MACRSEGTPSNFGSRRPAISIRKIVKAKRGDVQNRERVEDMIRHLMQRLAGVSVVVASWLLVATPGQRSRHWIHWARIHE